MSNQDRIDIETFDDGIVRINIDPRSEAGDPELRLYVDLNSTALETLIKALQSTSPKQREAAAPEPSTSNR